MKISPLISIIVPVYNARQYLAQCVQSIQEQTYSNIEIILIDDGSTDDSGAMCDQFASSDARIKVIHSPNKGVSSARNIGLELALGEFITFVDSDDTVEKDFVDTLYSAFEPNIDMTICQFNYYAKNGKITSCRTIPYDGMVLDRKESIKEALHGRFYAGHSCNKMFRKSLIGDLRFREDIAIYEDLLFVEEYLLKANSVKLCARSLYNYFYREDSAMHKKMSPKRLDALTSLDTIETKLSPIYGSDMDEYIAFDRLCWAMDGFSLLCYDKENRKEYEPILRPIIKKYKNNKLVASKNNKLIIILLVINPRCYYLIKKLKDKIKRA